jgi:radical SAM protein with 4Fe4S-binding SPASM domain
MKFILSDYGFTILMIETKLVCNMECKFCAYPLIDNKGSELSTQDVYRIIDSIDPSDSKFESIYFQKYNEPLLDKRIFDFINYAKNRGLKTQIITNGLLFRSKDIRSKLLDAEPTYILISLQIIDKHKFSHSRGISYSFEDYKKGIFAFLEDSLNSNSSSIITIDVACNFLSNTCRFSKNRILTKILGLERGDPSVPNTLHDIQGDLIDFLKDLHTYNSSFVYDKHKIERYLETVDPNYLRQVGLPISKYITVKIKQFIYGRRLNEFYAGSKYIGCNTMMLSIDAKGSVVPCCLAYGDMLTIGNIKDNSLKNILEKTAKFINDIRTGEKLPEICAKCHGEPTRRGSLVVSIYLTLRRLLQ